MEICKQEAQHFLSWAVRLEEGYGGMRCVPRPTPVPRAVQSYCIVLYFDLSLDRIGLNRLICVWYCIVDRIIHHKDTHTHTHTHTPANTTPPLKQKRYGDLKGTETLWECARATADDALARLAVINLVHEARGLDTSEGTVMVGLFDGVGSLVLDSSFGLTTDRVSRVSKLHRYRKHQQA